jgi:hypothetical protein
MPKKYICREIHEYIKINTNLTLEYQQIEARKTKLICQSIQHDSL